MRQTRPPYASEFCCQMVDLVRAGRDRTDLACEFKPSAQAIHNWGVQADRDAGRHEARSVLTPAERENLTRLRREILQLRLERDIRHPLKGRGLFARETGAVPSGSSGS